LTQQLGQPINNIPMRVLVFPFWESGHYLNHAQLMARAFAADGHAVSIALADSWLSKSEYIEQVKPIEHLFTRERLNLDVQANGRGSSASIMAEIARLTSPRAMGSGKFDYVYFPTADPIAQFMGARRLTLRRVINPATPTEALIIGATRGYRAPSALRRWRNLFAARMLDFCGIDGLSTLDPVLLPWINKRAARAARWQLIPDPCERPPISDKLEARRRLGLPEDGRMIIALGVIDRRKGADLLLRGFLRAKLPPTDRLVLIGQHREGVAEMVRTEGASLLRDGRLISIDRFVSTDDMLAGFSAADVVGATYAWHPASASIVIRAAAAERPSLGNNNAWIGRTIPQFDLGWTAHAQDPDAMARGVEESLDGSATWTPSARCRAFVSYHTIENFNAHVLRRIRRLEVRDDVAGLISWDQVCQVGRG
jgi:glycosyltransferase involved in cell wall biosynthesis